MPYRAISAALLLGLLLGDAGAQEKYPNRPVRIVTPFAPGSVTDVVARLLGENMRPLLGQAVVVDNKPGAFGIVAAEDMARAKPDGHVVMIGNTSTNVITPINYPKKYSLDYGASVVPVMRIAVTPMLLVAAGGDFPVKTFADFVAYAKRNPGALRYGSTGVAQMAHYQMEVLARAVGVELRHIPNKLGSPGVLKDMLAGDVQVTFLNVSTAVGPMRAGQIRAIAVMAEARLPDLPDVPTLGELGYPNVDMPLWAGLFAPAATPVATLEALHAVATRAIASAPMQEIFRRQMIAAAPTASLAEAKTWIAQETDKWARIVREVKVETE